MSHIGKGYDINKTFIVEPLEGMGPILSACTALYTNNIISCSGNTQIFLDNGVIRFDGIIYTDNNLSASTIYGSTFYGDGSNLTGISTQDTFITGGTYSNGTAVFTNNTGGTFNVGGFFKTSDDIFVTGMTFNSGNYDLIITRNDGNSFTQNLSVLSSDMTITGGTYNPNSGVATFTNNTGGTFSVSGFLTGQTDTYVTGGSFTNNVLSIKQTNNQSDVYILLNSFSGLTATTISATTYQNLPIDIRVTGGTYSNGTAVFTNNTGGTFSVSGFTTPFTGGTVTGATRFTNGLTANTISATTYLNIPYWVSGSTGVSSIKTKNTSGLDATGDYSLAEGYATIASGNFSHAEGANSSAIGPVSHAEGYLTTASGYYSHAEGYNTKTNDNSGHAEGDSTVSIGVASHAEGSNTTSFGVASHAEGYTTTSVGIYSHTEGGNTTAIGNYSHAEGAYTTANGLYSHAEGYTTTAIGNYSHAEGYATTAIANYSHAEGYYGAALGESSHIEGEKLGIANNHFTQFNGSHVEGGNNISYGPYSHSEGANNLVIGVASHAEGINNLVGGPFYNIINNINNNEIIISGDMTSNFSNSDYIGLYDVNGEPLNYSLNRYLSLFSVTNVIYDVFNNQTSITITPNLDGYSSTPLTIVNLTKNSTNISSAHAEGISTKAIGIASHTQGTGTTAIGIASHAGGLNSTASGYTSFVHGNASNAGGTSTIVLGDGITGTTDNTTYVNYLNLYLTPNSDDSLTEVLSRKPNGDLSIKSVNSIISGITYITNFSYNDSNTFTLTDNLGGTLSSSFNIVSGLTVTNTLSSSTINSNSLNITGGFKYVDGNQSLFKVLTSDLSGNTSWQYPVITGTYVLFFTNTPSDIVGYLDATTDIQLTPLQTITNNNVVNGQTLATFISSSGGTGINFYPQGIAMLHIHAANTNNGKETEIYFELYKRTVGGVETLMGVSNNSGVLTNTQTEHTTDLYLSATTANTTDRLVVKVIANVSGGGTPPNIDLYVEDNTLSRIQLPSNLINSTNYVPYSGATTNLILGPYNLYANIISATTYQNLPIDIQITGGTYSNNTGIATLTNNTGGTVNISGFTTSFTGGTVNGLTATTISATTYQNLPIDIQITGGTYSNNTGIATLTNNTGGTVNISGFFTGSSSSISGITGTSGLSASTSNNVTTIGFSGGTISNATRFTNGLTANTISATTLSIGPTATGATFNGINTAGVYDILFGAGTTTSHFVTKWTNNSNIFGEMYYRTTGTNPGFNWNISGSYGTTYDYNMRYVFNHGGYSWLLGAESSLNAALIFPSYHDVRLKYRSLNSNARYFRITTDNLSAVDTERFGVQGYVNSAIAYFTNITGLTIGSTAGATEMLEVVGRVKTNHIVGRTSSPTISGSTGAGTSPTVSINGTDLGGNISVTTGTSPATSSIVARVTFNTAYGATPKCVVLTPANSNSAQLSGTNMVWVDQSGITTAIFSITSGSVALNAATTYQWYYMVIQ